MSTKLTHTIEKTKKKDSKPVKKIKAWAIIDIQKSRERFCYADEVGSQLHDDGGVAVFFKRPKIHWKWKPFKKIIRVEIKPLV